MERTEQKLKNLMKADHNMVYPDFEQMWCSIEQDELKMAEGETIEQRPRRRKKFALAAGLAVALMATPVYAALNYDWSNILSYRAGIQSALAQGLGQTIEQSITKDGFTLTVHTAFIDDNRTSLLYSLKPNTSWDGNDVRFDQIGLKDSEGNFIEGVYLQDWNEELGMFQGIFETEWVAKDQTTNIDFTIEGIQIIDVGKQSINYDPNNFNTQVLPIHKDGIDSVTLHSFEHSKGKVLLQSTVTFTDPDMQDKGIFIEAMNVKDNSIQKSETFSFHPPGEVTERYLSQQIFKSDVLQAEGAKFQLTYDYITETKESTWNINMDLSKKHLENGSFKQVLNIPLDNEIAVGAKIHEIKVTPTQVRLIFTSKDKETYIRVPYNDYYLDVGGTLLKGRLNLEANRTELHFEMVGLNATALANQPVTLVAKERVNEFEGDSQPVRLTNISDKPQTKTSSIGGYPITWTYYKKDNYFYVESSSTNPSFGGVGQTYYLDNNERVGGIPRIRLDHNKIIDEYDNFNKKDIDIYIWKYATLQPDEELRIPLRIGE
ncbi:DUF4179 domain-containing protein [Lysinibacillus sphaericus]|uniref:DUF4179 domain-containing protein n=1 Tax=Lysinibacillus sphaericus TaxID=1421 RepID=UPI0005668DAC|nr:DUF4179 domain-containing protein [Lysinibacillus sphaericus]MBG9757760.1 RNA polymerase sigma factor [Lysinibacillus sphaericus]QTB13509.1 DUF4179 domain-containing protein [Lysinibacillus sphaericus]